MRTQGYVIRPYFPPCTIKILRMRLFHPLRGELLPSPCKSANEPQIPRCLGRLRYTLFLLSHYSLSITTSRFVYVSHGSCEHTSVRELRVLDSMASHYTKHDVQLVKRWYLRYNYPCCLGFASDKAFSWHGPRSSILTPTVMAVEHRRRATHLDGGFRRNPQPECNAFHAFQTTNLATLAV